MLAVIIHEKYISNASDFDKPLYLRRFKRQNNAIGIDRVLSIHRKERSFWNQFQFGCVSQDNKSVAGVSTTARTEGGVPRYGMC